MPRIKIEWLAIRSDEQREEIVKKITEVFVDTVNVRPDQVNIVFDEIPPHLSAKGGVFWTELLKNQEKKD